jgi:hypothetical protein
MGDEKFIAALDEKRSLFADENVVTIDPGSRLCRGFLVMRIG